MTRLRNYLDRLRRAYHRLRYGRNRLVEHPQVCIVDHGKHHLVASGLYWFPDHKLSINVRDDYDYAGDFVVRDTVDAICHEHLHGLLYKLEGKDACVGLDNIIGWQEDLMHREGGNFSTDVEYPLPYVQHVTDIPRFVLRRWF